MSYRGRVKLFWCSLDKDGDVDKVLKDEDLDFSFKNLDEMQALIELVGGEEAARLANIKLKLC